MKTLKQNLLILAIATTLFACKKEENNDEVEALQKIETLNKKIQDIIPAQYLDSLKKLGLTINTGVDPINVEGYYDIKPMILKNTNIKGDFVLGHRFTDSRVKLFSQSDNLDIKLIGRGFLSENDTSIVTAISGTGKDFTIYGKVKSSRNGKEAIAALIISGTMENNTIKNMNYGLISISNKNGLNDRNFLQEGQGRLIYESDFLSVKITEKDFLAAINDDNKYVKLLSQPFLKP
ncbi:MAG: hypothetical protein EOP00_05900 [Pedobacter sp.]|nr:MAG: hypothetical protein EOP00_05900 [Pedobacter sp.]